MAYHRDCSTKRPPHAAHDLTRGWEDRGVNRPVDLFPILVPWGTAPCKTCIAELLQIAQPPKMHAFVSGVLELKSILGLRLHLKTSLELAGLMPGFFGSSSTSHRISDIAMFRNNDGCREVSSVALTTSLYRPSTKATASPPLDHEKNTRRAS